MAMGMDNLAGPAGRSGYGVMQLASRIEESAVGVDEYLAYRKTASVASRRSGRASLPPAVNSEGATTLALSMTRVMEMIASFNMDVSVGANPVSGSNGAAAALDGLRLMYSQITGEIGTRFGAFIRDHAPSHLVAYEHAKAGAVATLAEMRAFLSVVCDNGDDDSELGIDVLPDADWDAFDGSETSV